MRRAVLFVVAVLGGLMPPARLQADDPKFTAKLEKLDPPAVAEPVRTLLADEALVVLRDIGDHTGTTPHPEFCLMCPAEKDKSGERMEKKKLIELSSEVNDGKHPAVLLLFPNNTKDAGPKVVGKGEGVWVVNVRRPVVA